MEVDCTPEERRTLKVYNSPRLHILLLPPCKGIHIFLLPLCKGLHISSLDCNSHYPGEYITSS